MITIKNLTKRFGNFTAVNNISFSIKPGEITGFLGPNGAGKSTTMRMITGFYQPTAGTIMLDSKDVIKNPMESKKLIGYLPENSPAYKDMTSMEFLRFSASLRGMKGKFKTEALDRVIHICSLEPVLHQQIDTLSKGFLKRVCLAQAIIHDPPYLILDEPTDGLDPNQKLTIRRLIKDMGKNKTILISTHILEEIDACCSKIIIISRGKIIADSTADSMRNISDTNNTIVFETDKPHLESQLLNLTPKIKNIEIKNNEGYTQYRVIPATHADITDIVFKLGKYINAYNLIIKEFYVDTGDLAEAFYKITSEHIEYYD